METKILMQRASVVVVFSLLRDYYGEEILMTWGICGGCVKCITAVSWRRDTDAKGHLWWLYLVYYSSGK